MPAPTWGLREAYPERGLAHCRKPNLGRLTSRTRLCLIAVSVMCRARSAGMFSLEVLGAVAKPGGSDRRPPNAGL